MKKIKSIVCIMAIIGLVGPFTVGDIFNVNNAKAVTSSGITASVANSSLNATTTYTYNFSVNQALSAPNNQDKVVFNIQNWYGGPQEGGAVINFNNASITWVKDDGTALPSLQKEVTNQGQEIRIWSQGPLTVAAGSNISIKLSGVRNPSVVGSYSTRVSTGADTNQGWNEGEEFQQDNLITIGIDKFIEGYVRYNTGGKVTTCDVNANLEGNGQAWANGACDSNGFFRIAIPETGTYRLNLSAKWENGQQLTVDWIYDGMDVFAEVNKAGTVTKNFTVTKANATVKGKLLLPNGTCPSESWKYHVDVRNETGQGSGSSLNNECNFVIPVKAGAYKLSLWSENPKYYLPEKKLTLVQNQTLNLGNLKMGEKKARIQGRVTDINGNPINNLRMNMWGMAGWGEARTNSNGNFTLWTFKNAGDKETCWEVSIDEWEGSQKGLINQDPPKRVCLTSNTQTVTGQNFKLLKSNANIKVTPVNESGATVSGIHGWAYCRKATAMPGPGSDFGMGLGGPTIVANIPLLGGQTYKCGVHVPSEMGLSMEKEVETTVAVGQTKSVKVTLLQNNAEIVGFLRDAVTGEVITGVEGEVFAHGEDFGMGYNAFVNQDGSYRLSVRNGTYFVGYHLRSGDFMQGEPEHAPITVAANGRAIKNLRVHRANAHINVKVQKPNGDPVEWAWVWCDNWKQKEKEVTGPFEGGDVLHAGGDTKENGQATLGVVAGEYSCGAGLPPEMANFMPPNMVDVMAKPGTTAPVVLKFKESEGNLTGTATHEDGSKVTMGFCHGWNPDGGFTGGPIFDGTYSLPMTRGTWYVGCDTMDGQKFYRSEETSITFTTVGTDITWNPTLRESNWDIPEAITKTFDPSQLQVVDLPDGSQITFPANSVPVGTEGNKVTLTCSPNVDLYYTPDAKPFGFAWSCDLSENGQPITANFNSAVTITLTASAKMLAAEGYDLTKIVGKYWDENSSTWKSPDYVQVDSEPDAEGNIKVIIQLTHFTDFAITSGSGLLGGRDAKNIVTGAMSGAGPHVTVWDSAGGNQANFLAYASNFTGGVNAIEADVNGNGNKEIVTVPYSAGGPHLRVLNSSGEEMASVFPYVSTFRGGLSLAAGDIDGDGAYEIIVAPTSGGGPHVKVYKYANGMLNEYASFFAYPSGLRTGMNVYAGDVDGDGDADIVTSTRNGATPHVRTFDGLGNLLGQFFAFPEAYKGGVNVTLGDYNGDGAKDILVTPAYAGGPQYRVLTYNGGLLKQDFAYNSAWRLGLSSGMGDVDGDGDVEIVLAPVAGGGPHVQIFGPDGFENGFMAYTEAFRGGVQLEVADIDSDGTADIVTAPMAGGGPHIKVLDASGGIKTQFMSHHPAFRGGVNLSISK